MSAITTSLTELFKIGPGPSSSHTMAPMLAGYDFLQRIKGLTKEKREAADRIKVLLFGSLSATGVGHGTWPVSYTHLRRRRWIPGLILPR